MAVDTAHGGMAERRGWRTPAGQHRVPISGGHMVLASPPEQLVSAGTLTARRAISMQHVMQYEFGTAGTSDGQPPQPNNRSRVRGVQARGPAIKKPAHCNPASPDSGDPGNRPNASMCEDAVWYHVPDILPTGSQAHVHRPRPDVVLVAASFESSVNYPLLKNREFMSQFDIEQTYRVTAPMLPVSLPMLFVPGNGWSSPEQAKGFFRPPLPTAKKLKAIVTVNSNCHTKTDLREVLVKRLMDRFKVHSYGYYLKNRKDKIPTHIPATNIPLYKKYHFCVAMENSNTVDYVTEKVYEALAAGCGCRCTWEPPTSRSSSPSMCRSRMIVDRRSFATEGEYFAEIQRLMMHDDEAYEEYMAWKKDAWAGKPYHPAFNKYLDLNEKDMPRCELCRYSTWHYRRRLTCMQCGIFLGQMHTEQ
eukprot:jgi/Mesvir1/25577/Mv01808-RA.1